jgi:AmmeMemoRadiSam system protein A
MAYAHRLTDEEKQELLRIARATLREFLRTGRVPPGKPHRDSLVAEAGAFVSLHIGEALRGCIGTQVESKPLYKTIQEMAIAAASRDPRFAPVTPEEFNRLIIEISVLGDHGRVSGPDDIVIGEHGITIDSQGRRGLLLPQVASDNGWDAETFLQHVCAKAGMPPDSWREQSSELERFTAQVFSETTHPR